MIAVAIVVWLIVVVLLLFVRTEELLVISFGRRSTVLVLRLACARSEERYKRCKGECANHSSHRFFQGVVIEPTRRGSGSSKQGAITHY